MHFAKSLLMACSIAVLLFGSAGASDRDERDLAYGRDPKQRLDLTTPASHGFPTVVFIHGGSLTSGDKADDDYRRVGVPFVGSGIACANVNYRLAPVHAWPSQAEDVAAAVAWLRSHIASRGGDSERLFIMGHSSGAMLAALVGSDERLLARHGLEPGALKGVISMGSIMWDEELTQGLKEYGRPRAEAAFGRDPDNRMYGGLDAYLEHWPIRHVHPGLPPYLFLIAEAEREQPPVEMTNREFVEQARAAGCRAEYRILADRTHMSAIRRFGEPGDSAFVLVARFVQSERLP